ncbi:hypothetical protein [Nonomuraea gerenzanensis]|uniref:Uncharacterized protein n=1 Tax=Nonomuraea gerenzanensis TaxID=93944 RepID=A0A1M4EEW0_9ACTN|nr:hypothetical protein [Nonomuraea gerenzanensis]UBU08970.1 hypothetical protein LCN96_31855 [Nonomuraea gerenzanensis]SBO97350.1 hypothetical protein BN4615_P6866 [Nonomuraea gerenzanensis]
MTGGLFREFIQLSYHQIEIRPHDEAGPSYPKAFPNGLVAVGDEEPDGAIILTGLAIGQVEVLVRLAHEQPPLELDSWEEIVDISIESTLGSLYVVGLMGDLPRKLPNLAWKGPGFYRLRVHATGRDSSVDGSGLNLEERYFIVSWPADPAPDLVYKATDAYGAGRRGRAPQAGTTWPTRKNPSGS